MRRAVAATMLAVFILGFSAPAASAHSASGAGPTNYRTRLLSVTPQVPGVAVKVVDTGRRLELSNRGDREVLVFGYQGEPYLRVGPQGVFENIFSPARYLNVGGPTPAIPATADAGAAPTWRQVSGEKVFRWHDHRIHWMSPQAPPDVRRDPGRVHVINARWAVPMTAAGTAIEVTGDLMWVPGPSPLPWVALAVVLGAVVVWVLRRRTGGRALAVATALLVAVDVVHALGVGLSAAGPLTTRLGGILPGNLLAVAAWISAGIGMAWLHWRKPGGYLLLAAATALIAFEGGVVDLADLSRSQLPFVASPLLARSLVAVSLGVGVTVAAVAALAYARSRRAATVASQPVLQPSLSS